MGLGLIGFRQVTQKNCQLRTYIQPKNKNKNKEDIEIETET